MIEKKEQKVIWKSNTCSGTMLGLIRTDDAKTEKIHRELKLSLLQYSLICVTFKNKIVHAYIQAKLKAEIQMMILA